MKTFEDKKKIVQNFEGFYVTIGYLLYENPDTNIVQFEGNYRFQKPNFISSNYNTIMGQSTQILSKEKINNSLNAGASIISSSSLFNNAPQLYILKWNHKLDYYEGNLVDVNDLTQFSFNYDGNMNIEWSCFELNNDENNEKGAGYVGNGTFYKTVSNNPTQEDIENFLFNPENCQTINLLFIEIQKFLIELFNLYQQGKIIQKIPQQWFSTTTKCNEQSLVLLDNLLKFYVNVNPNYYQTYFKQNIDIDNNLKLYNSV